MSVNNIKIIVPTKMKQYVASVLSKAQEHSVMPRTCKNALLSFVIEL